MPDIDFTKEIHKYAMESDDNLIVVVQTARSFDKLRKNLISGFAHKLEEKLKQELPNNAGWEISERSLVERPLEITYPVLAIRKTKWPQNLSVAITAEKSCKDVDYGVLWREPLNTEIRDGIFTFMERKFSSNLRSKTWPWYMNSREFDNWSQEDALISMRQVVRGESAEILKFFLDELVAIAKVLDQYLNPVAGSGAS